MKKILFLPLFKMPSGHHQVADALIESIQAKDKSIQCRKVDFLSYWNEPIEKTVAFMYLKWINSLPKTYNWVYQRFMYEQKNNMTSSTIDYVQLLGFETKMLELVKEERPDLIVCTHCFPSSLMNRLKKHHFLNIPTVNVYTDFFMNGIWGKDHIDLHLVNDELMKRELVIDHGVPERQIAITGIPTSEDIVMKTHLQTAEKTHILVAGGSSGVGRIIDYLKTIRGNSKYEYTVLCGKNEKLYNELKSWNAKHIYPLPYIEDRTEMNQLYEQADAIITKPGGITISEALKKRLLIFVHTALPGQEQLNLKGLLEKQLIIPFQSDRFEEEISVVLDNEWRKKQIFYRMEAFLDSTESSATDEIVKLMNTQPILQTQLI